MAREWDATAYDALTLPHEQWGLRVLDRMDLRGDERVLDAGCGTGRDALVLRERWPKVDLVALDASARMLDVARGHLGDDVTLVRADLAEPLPLAELGGPVDAVMSVAAFHWVRDHDALFAHLAAAMRPGATLTSDCGGRGNVASVDAAIARVVGSVGADADADTDAGVWEFPGAEDTRERLARAGLEPRRVELRPHPFAVDDPDVLEAFLATVVLGSHLAQRPEDEHADFVREVRRALPAPVVDYVRLEIDAVRR